MLRQTLARSIPRGLVNSPAIALAENEVQILGEGAVRWASDTPGSGEGSSDSSASIGQWGQLAAKELKADDSPEPAPEGTETSPPPNEAASPQTESVSAASTQSAVGGGFPEASLATEKVLPKDYRLRRTEFLSRMVAQASRLPQSELETERKAQMDKDAQQTKRKAFDVAPHDRYGFIELSGQKPEDLMELNAPPAIHPTRTFMPGQKYDPEDLSPLSTGATFRRGVQKRITQYSNEETMERADFKNLSFLNNYVTDGGRLIPRRITKLKAKVHSHLMRQIKLARTLALLPYTERRREFQRFSRRPPSSELALLNMGIGMGGLGGLGGSMGSADLGGGGDPVSGLGGGSSTGASGGDFGQVEEVSGMPSGQQTPFEN